MFFKSMILAFKMIVVMMLKDGESKTDIINVRVQIGPGESCCPIRVAYLGPAGRGLVATRPILPGEVIFNTQPAVLGPCVRYVQ